MAVSHPLFTLYQSLLIRLVIPMPSPFGPIWQAVQSGSLAEYSSRSGNSSRILASHSAAISSSAQVCAI